MSQASLPIFDTIEVVNLENYTVEDVMKLDKDVFKAIDLFNSNKFDQAITMLAAKADNDAIHAIAVGFLLFMRAISTFNKEDIEKAMTALELAISVADSQNSRKPGLLKRFSTLFTNDEMHWISARSFTITCEANLLSSFLFIFEESVTGLIKAGLYLTKGIRGVEEVYQWYTKIPEEELSTTIDEDTKGALLFVMGAVNIAKALLPPKVMKLISIFGYSVDMDMGFQLMHQCEQTNSIYSKIAPLFLLGIFSILLSFAPGTQSIEQYTLMQTRLDSCLKDYPDCVFYLILASRFKRSQRDLKSSIKLLEKSITVQEEWSGLLNLGKFELTMTLFYSLDFQAVFDLVDSLQKETFWSKAFFSYCKGACKDMLGEDGFNFYLESIQFVTRKFSGRSIAIEQFVTKRVQYYQSLSPITINNKTFSVNDQRKLLLPGLEICFLFMGFSFMGVKELEQSLVLVNASIQTSKVLNIPHFLNHLNLLKCGLTRNLNIIKKTYDLSQLIDLESIQGDAMDWLEPFSVFEQGQLHLDAYLVTKNKVYLTRAKELLVKAMNYSGYVLEFRYYVFI